MQSYGKESISIIRVTGVTHMYIRIASSVEKHFERKFYCLDLGGGHCTCLIL